ncbi:iron reductase, partial [Escherichia coli]|nr:iron reductase [Escherichia coli]
LGGLDKAWRLHKWAGICAIAFAFAHWLDEKLPQLFVAFGWLTHPGKIVDINLTPVQENWLHAGLLAGECAMFIIIAMVCVSLSKRVPYHLFHLVHRLFPVFYLAIAFHVFTALFKSYWWETPAAYLLILITIPGVFAAFISLLKLNGSKNKHQATIKNIVNHPGQITEVTLELEHAIDYSPGQFAFLTFAHSKESHPFTIASYTKEKNTLRFAIKNLGDYTSTLASSIKIGQSAFVEGPWGKFDFTLPCSHQVWIAGGIGITPFIAQLEYRKHHGASSVPVDLWYCVSRSEDAWYVDKLTSLCAQARVTLHLLDAHKGERLQAHYLTDKIANKGDTHFWFCGPQSFAKALSKGLYENGIASQNFHYDRFCMR